MQVDRPSYQHTVEGELAPSALQARNPSRHKQHEGVVGENTWTDSAILTGEAADEHR